MIGRINGILLEKNAPDLLIDVHGVGYEIAAPLSTCYQLPAVGERVELFTHFVVREDAQQLYGFANLKERDLFRLLIKVNGIGPKLGLAILSSMEPKQFVQCIANEDVNALVRLPGIGKKTAERLLIEMADRLKDWFCMSSDITFVTDKKSAGSADVKDAISALVSLGYKPQQASHAMTQFATEGLSTEDLIKQALRQMMGGAG
jgi:Holliday junction DNA helicase RuvA